MPVSYPYGFSCWYGYDKDCSASLTSFASSSVSLSAANICSFSTFNTYYHDGSGALPTTNNTVYSSSSGGSSNYLSAGYYRATTINDDIYYQIGSNGVVTSTGSCIP